MRLGAQLFWIAAQSLTWAGASLNRLTDELKSQYPKFQFVTRISRECSPNIKDSQLTFPPIKEHVIGWIGQIFEIEKHDQFTGLQETGYEFSFYSPRGAEACEKVTVSSINHKKELEQFHQHLIKFREDSLLKQEGVDIVILSSAFEDTPISMNLVELSLEKLLKSSNFLPLWYDLLKMEKRSSFTITFDDKSDKVPASRGDIVVHNNKSPSALIQVVGRPTFGPTDYEIIHHYHPSMYSMIPVASMVMDIAKEQEFSKKKRKRLVGFEDWASGFTCRFPIDRIILNLEELKSGVLNRILKSLKETREIITWTELTATHAIDSENPRLLEALKPSQENVPGKSFDLLFTLGIDFEEIPDKMLEEYADTLESIVSLQYEILILRALSKVPSVNVLHLYPLLPMSGILEEVNLRSLCKVLKEWVFYGPSLEIVFYPLKEREESPKDRLPWLEFYKSVGNYFNLQSNHVLFTNDSVTYPSDTNHQN